METFFNMDIFTFGNVISHQKLIFSADLNYGLKHILI